MPDSNYPWGPYYSGRGRILPYKYEPEQMYDPFQLSEIMRGGIPGKTAGSYASARKVSAGELGKEFSWLYGGRPLTGQEMEQLAPQPTTRRVPWNQMGTGRGITMAQGAYDPRLGTIGGMQSLQGMAEALPAPGSVTPRGGIYSGVPPGGSGAGYISPKGFGEIPHKEVGPTLQTRQEYTALEQLPYALAEQYQRVADQGIYGPAGMHQIVSKGIQPQKERTRETTTEALTYARAARQQTVQQGARMLAEKLGGQFASQPGLAMKLMGDQIIAPSLAKEMEMSIDLKVNEMNTLNALDGAIGDLLKANQESKMMGLAGVQDIMGFLQKRVADRWWDLSMENKLGWSPERTAAARQASSEALMALQQKYNLTNMKMDAVWRDWLNEQQYEREEGSAGGGGFGTGDALGWLSNANPITRVGKGIWDLFS